MDNNWRISIDKWLADLSQLAINKHWQVVRILKSEHDFHGQLQSKIPLHRFVLDGIKSEDVRAVLTSLEDRGIILVYKYELRESGSELIKFPDISKRLDESVFTDPSTEIYLDRIQEFDYVYEVLEKRQHSETNSERQTKVDGGKVGQILKWSVFTLDTKTGEAIVNNKKHNFNPEKPPFKILKALLEKRGSNQDDGEVNFKEFTKVTGITDKETIKSTLRGVRRELGISRYKNPDDDVFQETGRGYKLIMPKSSR